MFLSIIKTGATGPLTDVFVLHFAYGDGAVAPVQTLVFREVVAIQDWTGK